MRPELAERVFEAHPELDGELLERLRAVPLFRRATDAEVDPSYDAYARGDIEGVLEAWRRTAEPSRVALPPALEATYRRSGLAPSAVNAVIFLSCLRAVLRAGERFRSTLSPAIRSAVRSEFPWLERRHEHVPDGFTPEFEFPDVFREFVEHGDLDDGRARWQLAVALNEVQQCAYSDFAAELFRLPALRRHAARERDLARNYFAHWSPRCTRDLWRETIYVLDALNAAVFDLLCVRMPAVFVGRALYGALAQRDQWQRFVANLDTPQWLMAP